MKAVLIFFALLFTTLQTLEAQVPTNGLIGYWPFNGNSQDESVNSNYASPNGGVSLATDRFNTFNRAYDFDGTDDHFLVSQNSDTTLRLRGNYTIAVWIEPDTIQSVDIIRASGGNDSPYRLSISGTNRYIFATITDSVQNFLSVGNYPTNQWSFMSAISRNDSMFLYVNDTLIGTLPYSGSYNYRPSLFLIGTKLGTAFDSFNGKIDDIRIYNRAITDSEITALYNEGLATGHVNIEQEVVDWNISPNPVGTELQIPAKLLSKIRKIELFTIDGRRMDNFAATTIIPVADYPNGVYIIRIQTENGKQMVKKWVKE